MKKEKIILKWLNNTQLSEEELKAFKQLDAFDSYIKISEVAKNFKAPDYNVEENLLDLRQQLSTHKNTPKNNTSFTSILIRIAAVFVISIGIYLAFIKDYDTTISALANEKTSFELPDASIVSLNAKSSVTYHKSNWTNQREVSLMGEAHFKVAKGKRFDVHTASGTISVLGTEFNIKERKHLFEVVCYEGSVNLFYKNENINLIAGNVFTVVNNTISTSKTIGLLPDWQKNKSSFKSLPYDQIIKEFERQYNVNITTKNIDVTTLFTGSFIHSDIKTALQSITIPMRLKYTINAKNITLYKE